MGMGLENYMKRGFLRLCLTIWHIMGRFSYAMWATLPMSTNYYYNKGEQFSIKINLIELIE